MPTSLPSSSPPSRGGKGDKGDTGTDGRTAASIQAFSIPADGWTADSAISPFAAKATVTVSGVNADASSQSIQVAPTAESLINWINTDSRFERVRRDYGDDLMEKFFWGAAYPSGCSAARDFSGSISHSALLVGVLIDSMAL